MPQLTVMESIMSQTHLVNPYNGQVRCKKILIINEIKKKERNQTHKQGIFVTLILCSLTAEMDKQRVHEPFKCLMTTVSTLETFYHVFHHIYIHV